MTTTDPLAPARGIALAMTLGLALWTLLAVLIVVGVCAL